MSLSRPRIKIRDIALDIFQPRNFLRHPGVRNSARPAGEMRPERSNETGLVVRADLAKIGDAGRFPEQPHHLRRPGVPGNHRVLSEFFQHRQVDGFRRGMQALASRLLLKRADQPVERSEIGFGIAPV